MAAVTHDELVGTLGLVSQLYLQTRAQQAEIVALRARVAELEAKEAQRVAAEGVSSPGEPDAGGTDDT